MHEKTTWPDVRPVIFWDQQEVQMGSNSLHVPPGSTWGMRKKPVHQLKLVGQESTPICIFGVSAWDK